MESNTNKTNYTKNRNDKIDKGAEVFEEMLGKYSDVNRILFRRRGKIIIPDIPNNINISDTSAVSEIYDAEKAEKAEKERKYRIITAMAKNIEAYGFNFSPAFVKHLCSLPLSSPEILITINQEIMKNVKEMTAGDVEYHPMYPGFPEQVAEMDEAELYINAIIHYLSFGTLLPDYSEQTKKNTRFPLIPILSDDSSDTEKGKSDVNKIIDIGEKGEVVEIFKNLICSKTSISIQDREDLITIAKCFKDEIVSAVELIPYSKEIPLKENVALAGVIAYDVLDCRNAKDISIHFKTPTDVLRLITLWSDGDVSLSQKTIYKNLTRGKRRFIMELLSECYKKNNSTNFLEDMYRYAEEWKRVGEKLHPSEYTNKNHIYHGVGSAFIAVRNLKKPLFFGGSLNQAYSENNITKAVDMLSARPGEFARNLDKLLRMAVSETKSSKETERTSEEKTDMIDMIIDRFNKIADKVSPSVLLQVRQHFIDRTKNDIRVFFLKGSTTKVKFINNELPFLPDDILRRIVAVCENGIYKQFRNKYKLGKVYVDPELRNCVVPFSLRNSSKGIKSFVRGSRVKISDDKDIIRAFIWWTNQSCDVKEKDNKHDYYSDVPGRVDIDLSATIYDENWNYLNHISYTNLRSNSFSAYHSGDITNGGSTNGKGVAEFIDISIDKIKDNSGRYVVFQVHNFTQQKFSALKNCRFGWMERDACSSEKVDKETEEIFKIFDPATVKMAVSLTSDSISSVPVIFDCEERKFVWCDMNIPSVGEPPLRNNLETNFTKSTAICYSIVNMGKPDLYTLCRLNAFSRGTVVRTRDEADVIFSFDTTIPTEKVTVYNKEKDEFIEEERQKENVKIITPFDLDYIVSDLL